MSSYSYLDYASRRFTEKSPQFLRFVSVTESHTYITPMCMYRVSLVSQYITIAINSRWISWFSSFYAECLNQDRNGQFKNSEMHAQNNEPFSILDYFFFKILNEWKMFSNVNLWLKYHSNAILIRPILKNTTIQFMKRKRNPQTKFRRKLKRRSNF